LIIGIDYRASVRPEASTRTCCARILASLTTTHWRGVCLFSAYPFGVGSSFSPSHVLCKAVGTLKGRRASSSTLVSCHCWAAMFWKWRRRSRRKRKRRRKRRRRRILFLAFWAQASFAHVAPRALPKVTELSCCAEAVSGLLCEWSALLLLLSPLLNEMLLCLGNSSCCRDRASRSTLSNTSLQQRLREGGMGGGTEGAKGASERARERGSEGARERGSDRGKRRERKGGRKGGREEGEKEGAREGGRERKRQRRREGRGREKKQREGRKGGQCIKTERRVKKRQPWRNRVNNSSRLRRATETTTGADRDNNSSRQRQPWRDRGNNRV
jgi:hypothetical protein